jgi:hypothetical protein
MVLGLGPAHENTSPNRTPMSSTNGKAHAPAPNPMTSYMGSMGVFSSMAAEAKPNTMPAMVPRAR